MEIFKCIKEDIKSTLESISDIKEIHTREVREVTELQPGQKAIVIHIPTSVVEEDSDTALRFDTQVEISLFANLSDSEFDDFTQKVYNTMRGRRELARRSETFFLQNYQSEIDYEKGETNTLSCTLRYLLRSAVSDVRPPENPDLVTEGVDTRIDQSENTQYPVPLESEVQLGINS